MISNIEICQNCVMDTTDEDIEFFNDGTCSNCRKYSMKQNANVLIGQDGERELEKMVLRIKKSGQNKQYDCITGLSGGVDSTFLCHLLVKLGLRPLVVHFDNGWNSELAVKNIQNTLESLKLDFYTHVVDWEEFRDLQLAFLKASTPDLEVTTDFAINATLRQVAKKMKIKYIVSGNNIRTEGIMAANWSRGQRDWRYIRSVHKKFGTGKLKTYPSYGLLRLAYYVFILRQKIVKPLNLYPYDKEVAMDIIKREFDWRYYGGKHYESIITKFYQGYILPVKFGYDKRKAHLSALICSDQMSRERALEELEAPIYPENQLKDDTIFFRKKFNLSEDDFKKIMSQPPRSFFDFPSYQSHPIYRGLRAVYRGGKKIGLFGFVNKISN